LLVHEIQADLDAVRAVAELPLPRVGCNGRSSERVVMHTEAQGVLISGPAVTAPRELFRRVPRRRRHSASHRGDDGRLRLRYDMRTDPHPLTGYFLGDFPISTNNGHTRLTELAHPARPLLLNLAGDTRHH
jgi:hypothetical protein